MSDTATFFWSLIKLARHGVQLGLAVHGQVGALWEILAQKTVGVLVSAALPGTVGVAEVHLKVGGQCQALVVGQLLAPVPGQRPAQFPR